MRTIFHYRALLLLTSCLVALNVPAFAADSIDPSKLPYCDKQKETGQQSLNSHIITRTTGHTPPSAEYRRPADEVVTLRPEVKPSDYPNEEDKIHPFESGSHILTDIERAQLTDIVQRLDGKKLERVEIIGYADEQQLTENAQEKYGDNLGLSQSRAKEVAAYLRSIPSWRQVPMLASWLGTKSPLVTCANQTNGTPSEGIDEYQSCLSPNRRVDIRIWYASAPAQVASACTSASGVGSDLPFRISVDGEPLAAADKPNSADVTRCTDVALEKADIQVRYDGLQATPVLNVTVWPDGAARGEATTFTPYSNYLAFITKAELRIFEPEESLQTSPIAVIPVEKDFAHSVTWTAPQKSEYDKVKYVLRVYDKDGRFDETSPKMLNLLEHRKPISDEQSPATEALIGYGENHRDVNNIAVSGGSVTINGTHLEPGSKVMAMQMPVTVDKEGKFAFRQIVPSGDHNVSVVTEAKDGTRAEYSRTLYIPDNDWFYIALGDLTVGQNSVSGPAQLVTGDTGSETKNGVYAAGHGAFYVKGKIKGQYLLTASADTQEQPLDNLFSNFDSKDPRYLLRRIDPNAFYPVYGDDSTSEDDAPTRGKFYVKLARGDSSVMWGNFQVRLNDTDLVNYNRSLYGAKAEYKSEEATKHGERKTEAIAFVADPGTLQSLEEFRGTGGSLYYLKGQDVVVGSEMVRIEIRDKDSGIVLQTKQLIAGQDYEINYIQGRVLLTDPLSSVSDSSTLVMTGSTNGNPAYLVVSYEYEPTISAITNWTKGGNVEHWLNDNVKVGVTGFQQNGAGTDQSVYGANSTVRYAPGTYLKVEAARSEGAGSGSQSSQNGGFDFAPVPQTTAPNLSAMAYRAETSVDLAEVFQNALGKVSGYYVKRENGYSAPGQLTNEGVTQSGLTAEVPVNDRVTINAKEDSKEGTTSGSTMTGELGASFKVNPEDTLSTAARYDYRETSALAGNSSILAQTGSRTVAALKFLHAPIDDLGNKKDYEIYGIGQGTLQRDGTRSANDRIGGGGRYAFNDRVTMTGEITDGDGGWGGKVGEEYRESDRTSYYTNYQVDTEQVDNGYAGRSSTFAIGAKNRYSDSLSSFAEQRQQTFENGPSGLIHSFGLDYGASDRWTWGGRFERGTISDQSSGDFVRTALSVSTGYHVDKIKYAGTVEWRDDDGQHLGDRTSWLFKNNLNYQTSKDWRYQGGFSVARSASGFGSSLDANYTEFTSGFAYRPVDNDRLNTLVKYTYLEDQSSPGQIAASQSVGASDYQQRSHVFDIDAIYDLTPRLSAGGKFGYRFGELKDTTVADPQWFSSQAYLAIGRLDYNIVYEWDILGEYRYLAATDAHDARQGALFGVYRHINENVKLGAGYNFTDFSDDLTDLKYKVHGFFINALAKL